MKVTVNGVELDLAPGTSVIDAVFAAGYDVPYFCSQEYMSPIGACRMCLAAVGAPRKDRGSGEWILDEETGEPKVFWFPNLMATCTTAVMEGMVVDTQSQRVKDAQNGMVEFTLINHPLDCPVCDKGGACELQDRAYEYGTGESRFVFDKRHQEKHHVLSEVITLDRERCIHCKRCVRYFEEVPGDEVLDFIERGGHTYIGTLEDGLPSNFSGNITDICPVGALLDTTSRFRGRNWEYDHTRTTTLDDASGSAIVVDARTGRIERIKSGLHPEVNKTWIDDGIRFGHEYVDSDDRIEHPLVRDDGVLVETTWDDAAARIAGVLNRLPEKSVGVAIRADSTLEEGVGAVALAAHLGSGRVDHAPRPAGGVIPARAATLTELATADAILVIGDPTEETPAVDLRIKDALRGVSPPEMMPHGVPIADLRLKEHPKLAHEKLTVLAPYRTDLMKHAGRSAVYGAGTEAALLEALHALAANNADGDEGNGGVDIDVDALPFARDEAEALIAQLREAESVVIVYGGFVLADRDATEAGEALAKAVEATTLRLGAMANGYGLELTGVTPSHDRYAYADMLADAGDEVKALIVSNLDPAADPAVAERLAGLELLVVHSDVPTATTAIADVVLPAKTGYEKEGATVNLEGRVLPVAPAPVDSGTSEDFTGVVKAIGEALGQRLDGRSVRSARRALKRSLEIDLNELAPEGHRLEGAHKPKQKVALRTHEVASGALLLTPSMARPEYLARNPHLAAATGGEALRLNPADAVELGLNRGDVVALDAGGTPRRAHVQPTDAVPPGLFLLPATPNQPSGLVAIDRASIRVERTALEVA